MIDEEIGAKPYKVGDKLILEVTVTDEDISFDFIGKAIFNRISTEDLGFNINMVSFWKDKYINNIPLQLRKEIRDNLQKTMDEISDLIDIH
ncbi:hypothetical protein [Clostridium sp. VAP52]|uniref:hypothetical protein n=1 Tax=Clostridium sp. VAP52 TaxID=2949977 RepID=UPI00207AE0D3|nr:hypothetical protein [Clostridium sp. VAP52]